MLRTSYSCKKRSILVASTLLLVAGCGNSPKLEGRVNKVTALKADFGAAWPFTIAEGELACVNGTQLVFVANGHVYALNEVAARRYEPIDAIHAPDPDPQKRQQGIKLPLAPFLEKGRQLCTQR
ncbi:DUF2511 domain-containing protein [Gloeobacter violaceus]|uniref:Glr3532 protein n=1 Tax=Gloeobacter violaceus (strain ATCC 29082 / PCC 7421) TaxID=251221 RepID=Q7NFJ3_GLOVI|nr:DUF2511 domain-containing protein [Gloeobacter violaceus]BAC91473.1 glr3532 [Gloeobacter violaceus PCC 7421]